MQFRSNFLSLLSLSSVVFTLPIRREVPQEHSHEKYLTAVRDSLNLDNPDGIVDPVFGLLGNAAAAEGAGQITDVDCLQQATADRAFTNAKQADDVDGQVAALIYRALERNTGQVGLASANCTSVQAVNPEIAAIQQHQDPASDAASANKDVTLELAKQIAAVGGDLLLALDSGTFEPGDVNDPTAAGNTCNDANDPEGCIFTQNLLVPDATEDEILAAVGGNAGAGAGGDASMDNSTDTKNDRTGGGMGANEANTGNSKADDAGKGAGNGGNTDTGHGMGAGNGANTGHGNAGAGAGKGTGNGVNAGTGHGMGADNGNATAGAGKDAGERASTGHDGAVSGGGKDAGNGNSNAGNHGGRGAGKAKGNAGNGAGMDAGKAKGNAGNGDGMDAGKGNDAGAGNGGGMDEDNGADAGNGGGMGGGNDADTDAGNGYAGNGGGMDSGNSTDTGAGGGTDAGKGNAENGGGMDGGNNTDTDAGNDNAENSGAHTGAGKSDTDTSNDNTGGGDTGNANSGNNGSGSANDGDSSQDNNGGDTSSEQNLQVFTGALGGAAAPAVTAGGKGFTVEGSDEFQNVGAALGRSCDIQHNQCANIANSEAGKSSGITVNQCDQQNNECRAAVQN